MSSSLLDKEWIVVSRYTRSCRDKVKLLKLLKNICNSLLTVDGYDEQV